MFDAKSMCFRRPVGPSLWPALNTMPITGKWIIVFCPNGSDPRAQEAEDQWVAEKRRRASEGSAGLWLGGNLRLRDETVRATSFY
jgi:hypothetical protein